MKEEEAKKQESIQLVIFPFSYTRGFDIKTEEIFEEPVSDAPSFSSRGVNTDNFSLLLLLIHARRRKK